MFEGIKWGVSFNPSWNRTGMPEDGFDRRDAALEDFFNAVDNDVDYVALYYYNTNSLAYGGGYWERRKVYRKGMPKPKRPKDPSILTIPDGTKIINNIKSKTKIVELYIPASVEEIADGVFYNARNLKKVVFADNSNLKKIGDQTFENCTNLTSINLPSSLKKIGKDAFYGCKSLKSINLPNTNIEIESQAFAETGLKSIIVPSNVKLGGFDFADCEHLESAILPEGFETIEGIFYGCKNLKSVKLPNSLKKIGKYAFYCCESLKSINLPENISYIGENAFYCCESLKSINLPENISYIGDGAFEYSGIESIIIPNNVKSIERHAFMESALESITIPSSVEYIGSQAFAYCKNLKTVNILGNTTKMSTTAFHLSPASIIYNGSKQDLKNNFIDADNYDDFEYFPKNIVYKTESAQKLESVLAESFEKTMRSLQKEGLFENVKSFDLDFNGKGINIKLNEMAYKDDYEEYNKRGKEYDKRFHKTLRQKDALRNKMYRLKPVSFTFDGDTFTLKNTKVTETYDFYLIYKIDVTNSSGLLHTFGIRSYEANIDNADKFSSVESALDEVKLGRHIEKIHDHADIKYKDKEAFTEAFGEAFIEFIQPMLLRKPETTRHDDKYSSISLNRYLKDKDIKDSIFAMRDKAEASWRKEHFGVEGYEVGQTVEVYDGRSGGARSLGKIIKITPSGTATIQLEDGTTIVRRHVEDDENIILFRPRKNNNYLYDARDIDLVDPSTSTEDTIAAHKKAIGLE